MYRSLACAGCWRKIRPIHDTSRRYGVWATPLFPMIRARLFGRTMSWVPQSLLSRSVLLISALLVVSQLIWFGLYRSYNMRTQAEYLANQIAGVISTLSVALETMP